jgi:hypothetical protein
MHCRGGEASQSPGGVVSINPVAIAVQQQRAAGPVTAGVSPTSGVVRAQ